mmetsp:Transcript_44222/g.106280  ORF Transcript_44222/g.106280 Transcript_44222/m.106280 type:complete len:217 (-) Transcript_44222:11-661(-)
MRRVTSGSVYAQLSSQLFLEDFAGRFVCQQVALLAFELLLKLLDVLLLRVVRLRLEPLDVLFERVHVLRVDAELLGEHFELLSAPGAYGGIALLLQGAQLDGAPLDGILLLFEGADRGLPLSLPLVPLVALYVALLVEGADLGLHLVALPFEGGELELPLLPFPIARQAGQAGLLEVGGCWRCGLCGQHGLGGQERGLRLPRTRAQVGQLDASVER